MKDVKKRVISAIVAVIGSYLEDLVVPSANLRKDLKMDCFAFLLLSYELGTSYETISNAHTVQDLINLLEQADNSNE